VSESLKSVLHRLDILAGYDGPWQPLKKELPLLRERLRELHERETRMDDVLVVALVGGSGVGKSTLLNAIAGDELAKTSEFRPCTAIPTVYQPPGTQMRFEGWNIISGSALENLVLIDTPDSDTIAKHHRALVIEALELCDLILICGSSEKYLDEATWSLLRPLAGQRAMVCIETKAADSDDIRQHWLAKLASQGIQTSEYFRVNSRRTLDRKLVGKSEPLEGEYDFQKLDRFLRQELNRERVQRIKRSNVAGLLAKTVGRLHESVADKTPILDELDKRVRDADVELADAAFEVVRRRLFSEPHLWNFALGREIGLRAKGFVGTLYRVVEAVRTFPARMSGWLPWTSRSSAGHQAARLLSEVEVESEDAAVAVAEIEGLYKTKQSELSLAFAQAGFDPLNLSAGFEQFQQRIQERVGSVLRGPGRDKLIACARLITGWPLTLLLDAAPVAFLIFTCYIIVERYFTTLLPGTFFVHSAAVLAIILLVEFLFLSLFSRFLAWNARRSSLRRLSTMLKAQGASFVPERNSLESAQRAIHQIDEVRRAVQ
jgi:GTPase SAR1 family protein